MAGFLLFDLYGTLVDPLAIAAELDVLGVDGSEVARLWRLKQLEYSFRLTVMGQAPITGSCQPASIAPCRSSRCVAGVRVNCRASIVPKAARPEGNATPDPPIRTRGGGEMLVATGAPNRLFCAVFLAR